MFTMVWTYTYPTHETKLRKQYSCLPCNVDAWRTSTVICRNNI